MNLEELQDVAEKAIEKADSHQHCVRVCMAASCQSSGAKEVLAGFNGMAKADAEKNICVKGVGCMGLCSKGPLVRVTSTNESDVLYQSIQPDDVKELHESLGGETVERLHCPTDTPFFTAQRKIVSKTQETSIPRSSMTTSPPVVTKHWCKR